MVTETVVVRETRRKYRWPEVQLNLWIFVILAAASTVLGIFSWFMVVQNQLEVGTPWCERSSSLRMDADWLDTGSFLSVSSRLRWRYFSSSWSSFWLPKECSYLGSYYYAHSSSLSCGWQRWLRQQSSFSDPPEMSIQIAMHMSRGKNIAAYRSKL